MKENNRNEHILWLDGLRGIACILIFVHHSILAFFPSAYYGGNPESGKYSMDTLLAESPIGVVFNGNFWVCVFCVVSGLVLSLKVMKDRNRENLSKTVLKRYPRLALPMLIVSFLVYFMLKIGAFSNIEAAIYTQSDWLAGYYREVVSLKKVFTCSLYGVWFLGDNTFSTAFWMMSPLFMGSFFSYLISIVTWNSNRYVYIVYAVAIVFMIKQDSLLLCFAIGSLLAYMYYREEKIMKNHISGLLALILGIYLGGYPTNASPLNYYGILVGKIQETVNAKQLYHIIGAGLVIYGLFCLQFSWKILQNKIFLKLGKISYAVYLLHIPILFSVATKIFLSLYKITEKYILSASIGLCVSLAFLIVLAILFNRYIEKWCGKITDKMVNVVYR